MGQKQGKHKKAPVTTFYTIRDKYTSLSDIKEALQSVGLESSNLIIGVDFTKSNESSGKISFHNKNLHTLLKHGYNPYQRVIDVIGRTLEPLDNDKLIPAFGFGDLFTQDKGVFPFNEWETPCYGVSEVLVKYAEAVRRVTLLGPTNFAPLIRKAIEITDENRSYHILVIIADGQVTSKKDTTNAIIEASNYPLSIVMIGVGDGPWDEMKEFDDSLTSRKFDNFQFVEFNSIVNNPNSENFDVEFALAALMEIPEQFLCIKRLGYLNK
jgi:E3 ubiquitin-protein ligase RGLG